jgi:hypothetical protein
MRDDTPYATKLGMQTGLFKPWIRKGELHPVYEIVKRFYYAGDVLDDYPDSPGSAQQLSGEAASQLLDSATSPWTPSPPARAPRGATLGTASARGSSSSGVTTRVAAAPKASRPHPDRHSRQFTSASSGKGSTSWQCAT